MLADHALPVYRTARYTTFGESTRAQETWFVLHGYGQLARDFLLAVEPAFRSTPTFLVAPEGHSRYYLPGHATVGASWMTRDFRDEEIGDYVRLLEAVADDVATAVPSPGAASRPLSWDPFRGHGPSEPVNSPDPTYRDRPTPGSQTGLLGFSQGAATACRWLVGSERRFRRVILWGGLLPPDTDIDRFAGSVENSDLVLVAGLQDAIVAPRIDAEVSRLDAAGIRHRVVRYEGGHALDPELLRSLVTPV